MAGKQGDYVGKCERSWVLCNYDMGGLADGAWGQTNYFIRRQISGFKFDRQTVCVGELSMNIL